MSTAATSKAKTSKKATIPPPGRKMSPKEARAMAYKQFGKALARLAK
jgi:hypothetical protein